MRQEIFVMRARIIDLIRQWFKNQGFLEVETPIMVKIPEMEPHLRRFETMFISEDGKKKERCFLRTSPEIEMKKVLAAGFEKIFQITKVFRNGEAGGSHNPEFSMIEWYRTNADYRDIMNDTEAMIRFICEKLQLRSDLLKNAWEKLSVNEAFKTYANLDLNSHREFESFRNAVLQKKYDIKAEFDWNDLFFLIMLNEVEPQLKGRPVFLYDYPSTQAALSKKRTDDPFWAERFELYIDGIELCNAFSELNDPVEQRRRLEEDQKLRKKMGQEVYPIDEDFLKALETMPPSGGSALGIDRLVMVLLQKKAIGEVLLFPWDS